MPHVIKLCSPLPGQRLRIPERSGALSILAASPSEWQSSEWHDLTRYATLWNLSTRDSTGSWLGGQVLLLRMVFNFFWMFWGSFNTVTSSVLTRGRHGVFLWRSSLRHPQCTTKAPFGFLHELIRQIIAKETKHFPQLLPITTWPAFPAAYCSPFKQNNFDMPWVVQRPPVQSEEILDMQVKQRLRDERHTSSTHLLPFRSEWFEGFVEPRLLWWTSPAYSWPCDTPDTSSVSSHFCLCLLAPIPEACEVVDLGQGQTWKDMSLVSLHYLILLEWLLAYWFILKSFAGLCFAMSVSSFKGVVWLAIQLEKKGDSL